MTLGRRGRRKEREKGKKDLERKIPGKKLRGASAISALKVII